MRVDEAYAQNMSEAIEFEGVIEAGRGGGACIPVPFDPKQVFGTGKSVRVHATYDGFEAPSSIVSMGVRAVTDARAQCLSCHEVRHEADFVFSTYRE